MKLIKELCGLIIIIVATIASGGWAITTIIDASQCDKKAHRVINL